MKKKIIFESRGVGKEKEYDKKLLRLVYIITRLSDRGGTLTTADLVKEFNVTKRTIQRDVELLRKMHWPIDSDNCIYKFDDMFSLRKINVTPEEKFLLMLFCRLFSQVKEPFNAIAKSLLDKVLIASDQYDSIFDEISSRYKREIIEKKFTHFADELAITLEDLKYPPAFIKKIGAYLDELEQKIKVLCSKDKIDINVRFSRKYENNKPVAVISVPKTYFNDNTLKHDFSTHIKEREFLITTALPGKFHKSFRISLHLRMVFDFWGTHFKSRDITCFDEFAKYIGFTKNDKVFNYKCSYAAHCKSHRLLITEASSSWQKEIPMPAEEIKPFLHKKSGIPWSKSWDARKKVWKTKR